MSSPESRSESDYRYWAFISYSHADEAQGAWVHRALESYRLPKRLVGRPTELGAVPRRLFPIFRDQDELPGSPDLGGNLREALKASRNLIVVCSPQAAQSKWVNEEIREFNILGRSDRILCVISKGDPKATDAASRCFPSSMRGLDRWAFGCLPTRFLGTVLSQSLRYRDRQNRVVAHHQRCR